MIKNINKEHILILFGADSKLRWGRSFQLGKAFRALGHNVMYIDLPVSLLTSMRYACENENQIHNVEGVDVFRPYFGLPYIQFSFLRSINRKNIVHQICKVLNKTHFIPSILWVYSPYDPYISNFIKNVYNPKKVVYDCADDRVALAKMNKGMKVALKVNELEKKLCKFCSSVVCITQNLKSKKHYLHKNMHVVPNGIDLEMFNCDKILGDNPYTQFCSKIILYLGTIGDWVDQDLIIESARRYPSYSFVCIGPCSTDISKMRLIDNVYIMKSVDYGKVPTYIYYADLCIVPFLKNEHTLSLDSLKVLQYLAMKKNVLSTYYSSSNYFDGLIHVAFSKYEFINKISELMGVNYAIKIDSESVIGSYLWKSIASKALMLI